jgi:hypothetical protein
MNHSPKVVDCIWQRTLCGDEVVPFKVALKWKKTVGVNYGLELKQNFSKRNGKSASFLHDYTKQRRFNFSGYSGFLLY